MTILINYWAVLVAAVVNFALGGLWYGPLFGKTWATLMGMTPDKMEAAKAKGMAKSYIIMLIGSLVMAYVLSHAVFVAGPYLAVMNILGISAGIVVGALVWLGFMAPVTMGSVLWDGKPWKLWFLNAGYYLVALVIMGGILSAWR